MKNQLKIYFSLVLLFAVSLNAFFYKTPLAQAACSYSISFNADKSSVTADQTINFSLSLIRSGNSGECVNSVDFEIFVNTTKGRESVQKFIGEKFVVQEGGGSMAAVTAKFIVNGFDRGKLPQPNKFEFQAVAYVPTAGFGQDVTGGETLKSSGVVTVLVSGALGGSGDVPVNVYLKPNQSTFQNNSNMQVLLRIDPAKLGALDGSVTNISFTVSVNGKNLGSVTKPRAAFVNDQYYDTIVNSDNGFNNGTNIIAVSLWEAGTSRKLGDGNATVQIAGIPPRGGTPSPVTGTLDPNGGTPSPADGGTPSPLAGGGTANSLSTELRNPIATGDLLTLFTRMLKILMSLLGVISVATIVVGGFQMVLAQGNEEAYGKAKKTITWAVLGLIIALLSFAMILIVQNLLGAQLGNPKDYIN